MQWLAVQTYTLKSCSHILFVVVEFVSFQYWIVLSFFISLFIYFLHQLCWCNACFEGPYCMKNLAGLFPYSGWGLISIN